MIDFNPSEVARYYKVRFPDLPQRGAEWRIPCPIHKGRNKNFAVNAENGKSICHSDCGRGWDILGLEQELTGVEFPQARAEVFRIVGRVNGNGNGHHTHNERASSPLKPAAAVREQLERDAWVYHSHAEFGDFLRQVRFEHSSRIQASKGRPEKTFIWEHRVDDEWFSGTGGAKPPIYFNPTAWRQGGKGSLLLLEGWGKANAADALGIAAASLKELSEANVEQLAGSKVVIWPDNDAAGRKMAAKAAELLAKHGAEIFLIEPPAELSEGSDIIDAINLGWDRERILGLMDSAAPLVPPVEQRALPIADVPSIFSFGNQPITWAVDRMISMAAVTMIAADSGMLKTTIATAIARARSDGEDFAGIPTTRGEVLILDRGENTLPGVQERYGRLGITDGNGLRHYGDWLGDVPSPASALVLEYVQATNPKPLIIVDSLISFLEADENDSVIIRKFMRQLRQLATLGAGVIVLHHAGKDSSKKYRGSSDIKASVDVAYELEGIGDPTRLDGVTMVAFKSRFSVQPRLTLRFDGHKFWSDAERPCKTVTEQLRDLLIANPSIKSREFERLAADRKLGRDRARSFLIDGRKQGTISLDDGPNNAQLHTWIGGAK